MNFVGPSLKGEDGDVEVSSCAIDSSGGVRRSTGSRWYFAECNVVPSFSTLISVRTKREGLSFTKHDVSQLFSELSVLSDRHGLLGSVLGQIELNVSRKIILARVGLPGGVLNITTRIPTKKRRMWESRTLILQNLVSLPAPILTI